VLISIGKLPPSEPWRILEVAMNQQPDVLALRIGKQLKSYKSPSQALIPFTPNAAGAPEWIIEHVYVRGLNGSLSHLARTPGIDYIRKELAPVEWINKLVASERQQASGPQTGDFVRVLIGPCARLCGSVSRRTEDEVTVQIQMRTKRVTVHTNVQNVQLVTCQPGDQSFYFSS
jgi:hypothetical protein